MTIRRIRSNEIGLLRGNCTKPLPCLYAESSPRRLCVRSGRVIVSGNDVHFYYLEKSRFNDIDMGIALCHFGETCREIGIVGRFTSIEESNRPAAEGMKYCIIS